MENNMAAHSTDSGQVSFVPENGARCICMKCPVQANSQCAKVKKEKFDELMKKEIKKMPKPEDTPILYCATGRATCKDLKLDELCICTTCHVWKEHKLADCKPVMHYCRDGKPECFKHI